MSPDKFLNVTHIRPHTHWLTLTPYLPTHKHTLLPTYTLSHKSTHTHTYPHSLSLTHTHTHTEEAMPVKHQNVALDYIGKRGSAVNVGRRERVQYAREILQKEVNKKRKMKVNKNVNKKVFQNSQTFLSYFSDFLPFLFTSFCKISLAYWTLSLLPTLTALPLLPM